MVDLSEYPNLTSETMFNAVKDLFEIKSLDIQTIYFTEGDGCPVNDGDQTGFKKFMEFINPHSVKETCKAVIVTDLR